MASSLGRNEDPASILNELKGKRLARPPHLNVLAKHYFDRMLWSLFWQGIHIGPHKFLLVKRPRSYFFPPVLRATCLAVWHSDAGVGTQSLLCVMAECQSKEKSEPVKALKRAAELAHSYRGFDTIDASILATIFTDPQFIADQSSWLVTVDGSSFGLGIYEPTTRTIAVPVDRVSKLPTRFDIGQSHGCAVLQRVIKLMEGGKSPRETNASEVFERDFGMVFGVLDLGSDSSSSGGGPRKSNVQAVYPDSGQKDKAQGLVDWSDIVEAELEDTWWDG